ncbi:MAG: hypothetical protein AB7O38_19300, partial [Pirellulaceae bacterium]
MYRHATAVVATILGVSCLVAIVRGQEWRGSEPSLSPAGSYSAQRIPVHPPGDGILRRGAAAVPQRVAAAQAAEGDSAALPSVIRRPPAAERLRQVRESATARVGSSGSVSSRPVVGPVASNPVELGRRAQTSGGDSGAPAVLEPEDPADDGTMSVLKRAEERPAASTARRSLRGGGRSVPTMVEPAPQADTSGDVPEALPTRAASAARGTGRGFATRSVAGETTLVSSQAPALRCVTTGPKSVVVGQEATYVITVHNEGSSEASGVWLRVQLPDHVRVTADGSVPDTSAPAEAGVQRLAWNIASIPSQGSERVTLRVTPTESRAIPLQVDWSLRPMTASAEIAVLQPQLELAVFGPRDILFGETAVYTLRLSNPGTGDAHEVMVEFGYGNERLPAKSMGTIAAGQQAEVKVELNAREAGTLQVAAAASAAGGLQVQAQQQVLVRRAKVEVQVAGDPVAFAGSVTTYRVVVRNTGDAPATDLQATIGLPADARFVSGEGVRPSAEGYSAVIGTLAPGTERNLVLQCELRTPGENKLNVQIQGSADEETRGSWVTRVETLADLKLTINDPQGPVPTNKDAVYQLHIVNRGSKAATKVQVVAQFSQGIEPTEASGANAQLVTGQVIFDAIPRIE